MGLACLAAAMAFGPSGDCLPVGQTGLARMYVWLAKQVDRRIIIEFTIILCLCNRVVGDHWPTGPSATPYINLSLLL